MAKDPSVLFYTSDFLSGTAHFTREEKGFYIELLCHQQQKGTLTLDFIKRIGGVDFMKLWPGIMDKFLREGEEGFFNKRMRDEIARRKKFTESRRNNLKGTDKEDHIDPHMNNHMDEQVANLKDTLMENENENINVIEKDKKKPKKIVEKPKTETAIIYPFETETFKHHWNLWKDYRKQIKDPIVGAISEQAALKKLSGMARDELTAINIIEQSMANGWKGLFELKDNNNGKQTGNNKNGQGNFGAEFNKLIEDRYGNGASE